MRALAGGAIGGGAAIRFDEPVPRWVRWTLPVFLGCSGAAVHRGLLPVRTRAAFEAVGGFDETLYASEELTLCRALQQQGEFVILRESCSPPAARSAPTAAGKSCAMRCASPWPAVPACATAHAWTSGTRRAGRTRPSGAEPRAAVSAPSASPRGSRRPRAPARARRPAGALVDEEARRVVRRRALRVLVRRREADEEEEAGHHLLVEREVLRAQTLRHHLTLRLARDAPQRRHHRLGERRIVDGDRVVLGRCRPRRWRRRRRRSSRRCRFTRSWISSRSSSSKVRIVPRMLHRRRG